jgi:hypothetical protein
MKKHDIYPIHYEIIRLLQQLTGENVNQILQKFNALEIKTISRSLAFEKQKERPIVIDKGIKKPSSDEIETSLRMMQISLPLSNSKNLMVLASYDIKHGYITFKELKNEIDAKAMIEFVLNTQYELMLPIRTVYLTQFTIENLKGYWNVEQQKFEDEKIGFKKRSERKQIEFVQSDKVIEPVDNIIADTTKTMTKTKLIEFLRLTVAKHNALQMETIEQKRAELTGLVGNKSMFNNETYRYGMKAEKIRIMNKQFEGK